MFDARLMSLLNWGWGQWGWNVRLMLTVIGVELFQGSKVRSTLR